MKKSELERLRSFAQDVMQSWPDGGLDGGELQSIAEEHGLLRHVVADEPCGENCRCAEYYYPEDWPVQCYRKTSLLAKTKKPRHP